ncbi:MAG TPA: ATP-binding protein [Azospirillum sp.]|nr:ATP-binding protein [Azospirillum sp.]
MIVTSETSQSSSGALCGVRGQAMTLAAIDRLVHHATIFEMNVESYRRRAALERKRGPGRPPSRATINANLIDAPRQDA